MSPRNFKSHNQMRQQTYLKVINALKIGINSKRGIQDHTGLSWGSCSPVVNNLLDQEVIVAHSGSNGQVSGKGRKTRHFHFNRAKHLVVGMELDNHRITSSIASLGNELVGSRTTELEQPLSSRNISNCIDQSFMECLEEIGVVPEDVFGISFSIPGAVDVERGIWKYCERVPGIHDVDINTFTKLKPIPAYLYIQHNIHAHAYSVIPPEEIEQGNYVFLHVGNGMAMSANMGGILYGHRGFAGEIGHVPYPDSPQSVTCLCGKQNCLEAILNTNSILNYIAEMHGLREASLDAVEDEKILDQVAHDYILGPLVYASTIISNIFDPRRIIIEGEVLDPFRPFLKSEFESALRKSAWLSGPKEVCWYERSGMDGSYGALLHSSHKILKDFVGQIDLGH